MCGSPVWSPIRTRTSRPVRPGVLAQRPLRRDRRVDRVARPREREEEGVALRVDLGAAGARRTSRGRSGGGRATAPERLVAELLQQLRRPLDVGERERDRAGVERAHGGNRTRLATGSERTLETRCAASSATRRTRPAHGSAWRAACALEPEAPPQEERRIVSIIFVDLVGFTAQAEKLDPEDVRALLTPYHELVRREIESFGGVVEKFIGDAIMGVFGAPIAYGDDAERAVRAAFVVRDSVCAMPGSDLQIRIAVNTGEAVVSLNARPALGESMVAGDVVNTASRLQSQAPGERDRRRRDDVPRARAT